MKVLLIGDYCDDVFIEGECSRLAPEFPVPVFVPIIEKHSPGMAGNVLENLKSLSALEVEPWFPMNPQTKTRFVDQKTGHHFLRMDVGEISQPVYWAPLVEEYAAVLVSDYCKGYLTEDFLRELSAYCEKELIPWFLDTKRIIGPWAKGAILKINRLELETNLAAGVRPWEHVLACIVTNGALGMDLYGPGGAISHHVEGPVVEVRDGAGCGDTVLAALVVAYLENGFDLKGAMAWADKAGRVAVSKRGVVAVRREEVR